MFASKIIALLASTLVVSSATMQNADYAHVFFTFANLANCRTASLTNYATPNKIFIKYNQAITEIQTIPTDVCKVTTAANGATVYERKFEIASNFVVDEALKAMLTNQGLARPNIAHVAEIYATTTCSNSYPVNTTVTYFPAKSFMRVPVCEIRMTFRCRN